MKRAEIRKDYLLDKYVIIAPKRSNRPRNVMVEAVETNLPSPLTPDHIKKQNIIDMIGSGKTAVMSVKNPFPAVTVSNSKAYGTQEVVIETPDPEKQLADLGTAQIARVLEMYGRRTNALSRHKKLNYILVFKNEGSKAGASFKHAHSQIFATELMPPEIAAIEKKTAIYREKSGRSFYADLIEKEMKSSRRVYEDKHVAVFTPYASFYHYEIWIFTKRAADNISNLTSAELTATARALEKILQTLKQLNLHYNLFCHQVTADRHEHFCIKIQPRGSIWGGVELDSGVVINSIPPEEAAKLYRKAF